MELDSPATGVIIPTRMEGESSPYEESPDEDPLAPEIPPRRPDYSRGAEFADLGEEELHPDAMNNPGELPGRVLRTGYPRKGKVSPASRIAIKEAAGSDFDYLMDHADPEIRDEVRGIIPPRKVRRKKKPSQAAATSSVRASARSSAR